MILDNLLMFTGTSNGSTGGVASGANTDSPGTGTQNSTNTIDLHITGGGLPVLTTGQGARDLGVGDDPALKLFVLVTTTFTGGTSLQLALAGAQDGGTGTAGAFTNWWLSPAYAEAGLLAGTRLYDMDMPRPPAGIAVPRFLRMAYITVGSHSAGSLEACIVLDRFDQMYNATANQTAGGYPPGVVVAN